MEFRPCIDLHEGKVKQIVGSTLGQKDVVENFISEKDASYYAELFKRDGLKGGHVIMLGPGNEEQAKLALTAYPGGLQIGGGIHADNAKKWIDMGASHVIVTSYIFHDGKLDMERLERLVEAIGKEHIVLDLSCRKRDGKWFVVTDKWTKFSDFEVNQANISFLEQYCDEFLIHAVDVEGKKAACRKNWFKIWRNGQTFRPLMPEESVPWRIWNDLKNYPEGNCTLRSAVRWIFLEEACHIGMLWNIANKWDCKNGEWKCGKFPFAFLYVSSFPCKWNNP